MDKELKKDIKNYFEQFIKNMDIALTNLPKNEVQYKVICYEKDNITKLLNRLEKDV